jgi:hypothetical protein
MQGIRWTDPARDGKPSGLTFVRWWRKQSCQPTTGNPKGFTQKFLSAL